MLLVRIRCQIQDDFKLREQRNVGGVGVVGVVGGVGVVGVVGVVGGVGGVLTSKALLLITNALSAFVCSRV